MPMLRRAKLTKRTVDALSAPTTADDRSGALVWDTLIPGFGVRVYPSGRRVFFYQYRTPTDNRTRRLVLGAFPTVAADDARARATHAAGQVASGQDPKGDDTDAMQQRTLADVFPLYLAERRGKLAARTLAEYQRLWTVTLEPDFGTKRIASVTAQVVARWHSEHLTTPTLANRAVDLLGAFFQWAEKRGYRARHTNPATAEEVERYDEQRKSRSLSGEEYGRLGSALTVARLAGLDPAPTLKEQSRGLSGARRAKVTGKVRGAYAKRAPFLQPASPTLAPAHPSAVAALRFLVLSGWRENEALTLRWDAVNMERGVAVLTDTKAGRSERPLGNAALDVLRALPRVEGNPYVFAGEREGRHVADLKRLWLSVKHAARLEETAPLRLHDLRHSFTTVARDEMGLGDHVIARLVGHTLSGMTSRYGEVRDATVRNAANSIASTIAGYLSPTTAKVLAFPGHAVRA
jgi:integrase